MTMVRNNKRSFIVSLQSHANKRVHRAASAETTDPSAIPRPALSAAWQSSPEIGN